MTRRTVRPYNTRVVLPYQTIMGPAQAGPFLVCLTEGQIETLKYVLKYARREVNWSIDDSALPSFYEIPDETEFALVTDMLDDLEGGLMSPQCATDIADAIEDLKDTVASMVTCICSMSSSITDQLLNVPDVSGYVDEGLLSYDLIENTLGDPVAPSSDEERCELAQAMWYYVYQTETETLLPFANSTADTITNAIIAMSAFAGLASFVGIPFAVLSALFAAFVAWQIDGSISNFVNWLLGAKDEMICELYSGLPDFSAAIANVHAYIDAAAEPSFLDKALLKAMFTTWHFTMVAEDQQDNGTWDEYLVAGQCDGCIEIPSGCYETYPCDLDDWENVTMDCSDGFPRLKGGNGYYTRVQVTVPSAASTLTVGWIPDADTSDPSRIQIGLRRVSDGLTYGAIIPATKPKGVLTEDTYSIANQLWGSECELWVKQESWYAKFVYFCVDED